MRYLLGIDIGTSACKVALADAEGNIVAQESVEYPVYYPHPGWAEQWPEDWWEATCRGIRAVTASVESRDIAGIGVDGQSWSAIAVDSNGQVLCRTPIWMDTRAEEICREWADQIGEERLFALCGNPLKPSYTTAKVGWYKKFMPEVYEKADKILQSNSFIVYRLTGRYSQDLSQGFGWHCFDMRKGCWDEDMCLRMGLRAGLLPPIFACHDVVGCVTEDAARLTGLTAGIPVVAGGLDAACGTLGVGVLEYGETQEQGGQAGGMSICCDEPKMEPSLILGYHVVPDRWLLQGGTVGGGGVMRWLERELGDCEREEAAQKGVSSFAIMDERAAQVSPGSDGLIFLPYMAGERSPIWDSKAKGVYYGLDFSKTKSHIIRAALEGVAFSLRHNLDTAEKVGAKVEMLRSMGGAANSRLWTQIKADVTGKPICVPASDSATTMGAIMLAGVGTGVWSGFSEAVRRTVRVKRTHIPNEANRAVYDRQYSTYLKLYPALKTLYEGE